MNARLDAQAFERVFEGQGGVELAEIDAHGLEGDGDGPAHPAQDGGRAHQAGRGGEAGDDVAEVAVDRPHAGDVEDEAGGRAVADPPEHVVDERRRDLVGDVALQRDDESTPQLNNRCSVLEACPVVVHRQPTAIVGVGLAALAPAAAPANHPMSSNGDRRARLAQWEITAARTWIRRSLGRKIVGRPCEASFDGNARCSQRRNNGQSPYALSGPQVPFGECCNRGTNVEGWRGGGVTGRRRVPPGFGVSTRALARSDRRSRDEGRPQRVRARGPAARGALSAGARKRCASRRPRGRAGGAREPRGAGGAEGPRRRAQAGRAGVHGPAHT